MNRRSLLIGSILTAIVLLTVAGVKVSRLTRTRTIQETSTLIVNTQAVNGRWFTRIISAPDLATNLSRWNTNSGGVGGGSATNAQPPSAVLTNLSNTSAITNLNDTQFIDETSIATIRNGALVTNLTPLNLTNRGVMIQKGPQTNESDIAVINSGNIRLINDPLTEFTVYGEANITSLDPSGIFTFNYEKQLNLNTNLDVGGSNISKWLKLAGGQTASSILRLDSGTNVVPATIGTGLTFDGTTLAATGGGGGGGTTNLYLGGILTVMTNGNDALAISTGGRDLEHPWATITNALRYATNGDVVQVGPGRWTTTNIAIVLPVGVHLRGSGRRSSYITNSMVLNSPTAGQGIGIALATDSMVSGFYLAIDAHTNQYRGQIGSVGIDGVPMNRAFTNAVIADCEIEGGTDAIFVRHTNVCTLDIVNCHIPNGKSDVLVIGDNPGSVVRIFNTHTRAIGPYALYPRTDGWIIIGATAFIENSSSFSSNNVNWNKAMDLRSGAHVVVRNSRFEGAGTNPTNIFGEAGTLLELQTEEGYDTNKVLGASVLIARKTFLEASTVTSGVPVTNQFRSDYIGSSSATAIGLGTSNTFRWVFDTDGQMYPFADNQKSIGRDANRVKAVHSVTSVVNRIKMVNGQDTNTFLYLGADTNVAQGTFGSGLTFTGGTLTAAGGSSGPTTNAPPFTLTLGGTGSTNAILDWLALGSTNDCIVTLTANIAVVHTNVVPGKYVTLETIQDATGNWTATTNSAYPHNTRIGTTVTGYNLTTNAAARDVIRWRGSGTNAQLVGNVQGFVN